MTRIFLRLLFGALVLLWAPGASAQTFIGGGGVFVGVRLDGMKPSFTWGAELFATHLLEGTTGCFSQQRVGVGPLLQFAFRDLSPSRLTLAAHSGLDFGREAPSPRLGAELGGSFFFTGARLAVHTGLLFEYAPFLNLALRHQLLQNVTSLTAGVRIPPTYGEANYCVADAD